MIESTKQPAPPVSRWLAVTPIVCALTDRFPMLGTLHWRHALVHVAAAAALAAVLILVSCVLAAWGFEGRWLPALSDIRDELLSNWTLLVSALGFLTAIIQVFRWPRPARDGAASLPQRIAYTSRAGERFVDVDRIDWIEAQGNYVALHVGPRAHLVRETLANIQRQLDPARFVRIARRASRGHRKATRDHWQRRNQATCAADQSP
jgi:hypothetical protein